jgi:tetratricopeptide (TPR) repeat protein
MQPPHATLFVILALLLLPMRASVPGRPRRDSTVAYTESAELRQLRGKGNERFRAADYAGAARVYETGVEAALQQGDPRSSIRFLNNLGSASHLLWRYRDAARAYLRARSLAAELSDDEISAATSLNLSSVYFHLGEVDAAREAAERGLSVPPAASEKIRVNLLIQLALIAGSANDCSGAVARLREAIGAAREQEDVPGEAQAWNELGNILLDCRRLPEAEDALLESYRLRVLKKDPRLHFSYESLAALRLAEERPADAALFLDRALEIARDLGPAALWRPLFARGRAYQALGRSEAAYADLRAALRNLQDWRAQVLPADAFRVRSEVETHGAYSAFIETAGARYRATGQARYAEEAFAAAESGRAASLRALWTGTDRPRQLPEEYWRTRAELNRAETGQMTGEADDTRVRSLRSRLAEMEAAAGLELPPEVDHGAERPAELTGSVRHALAPDEVLISFHTGETATSVWAVTRTAFEMVLAPSQADLERETGRFVAALRESKPEAADIGRALFASLFGKLNPRILTMRRWTIAPDGPLFDLPFGALPDGGQYLIERRSLRMTTGTSALLRPAAAGWSDAFVGIGDPVYNRADRRGPRTAEKDTGAPFELPRLLGSGREVQACAKIWQTRGSEAHLYEGPAASKENLERAAARGPAVLHMAAHILFPQNGSGRGMLALSIRSGNEIELLSDTEVAGMNARVGLVVLNGCSSGRGDVLPGAGLMGMTRAWLAAGARAVVATRWPAPDQEAGAIFESLYRIYFERRRGGGFVSFGELLREAQLAEVRSGGRRADPSRWASYFCVETN